MKFNENLKELYLGGNRIIPEDCQNIGNILRTNHTLTHLDLRDNSIQVIVYVWFSILSGINILLCIMHTGVSVYITVCVGTAECWSPMCVCWHSRTTSRATVT